MPPPQFPEPAGDVRVKADFHLHSCEDPLDELEHSAMELLHRAHKLGFDAIAITLHEHVLTQPELFRRAKELGVMMVPAAELRIEGSDVVVVNISEEEAATTRTFEDLRKLRERRGRSVLIFAPHPYYVLGGSMGRRLEQYIDCFDAIELSHFHMSWFDLNRFAVQVAARYGMPLLATSDAHRLDFFGEHYSLVATRRNPVIEDVFDAIRAGHMELVSPAWPLRKFLGYLIYILFTHPLHRLARKIQ